MNIVNFVTMELNHHHIFSSRVEKMIKGGGNAPANHDHAEH